MDQVTMLVNPYRDHSRPCNHGSYLRCDKFINQTGADWDEMMHDRAYKCPGGARLPDDVVEVIVAFQERDDWRDATDKFDKYLATARGDADESGED